MSQQDFHIPSLLVCAGSPTRLTPMVRSKVAMLALIREKRKQNQGYSQKILSHPHMKRMGELMQIVKRESWPDPLEVDLAVLLCGLALADPKRVTMWAWVVRELYVATKETVTLDQFTREPLFTGQEIGGMTVLWVPNSNAYNELWEAQKVRNLLTREQQRRIGARGSDNLLDFITLWRTEPAPTTSIPLSAEEGSPGGE